MDMSKIPLRDLHLPEPISWWPVAYGWWLLLGMMLAIIAGVVWWIRRRRLDPRRYALLELAEIERSFADTQNKSAVIKHCNTLLKRTAMSVYERGDVASLSGGQWVAFLAAQSPQCRSEAFACLAYGPYQPEGEMDFDPAALFSSCRQWIKTAGKGKHKDV